MASPLPPLTKWFMDGPLAEWGVVEQQQQKSTAVKANADQIGFNGLSGTPKGS